MSIIMEIGPRSFTSFRDRDLWERLYIEAFGAIIKNEVATDNRYGIARAACALADAAYLATGMRFHNDNQSDSQEDTE